MALEFPKRNTPLNHNPLETVLLKVWMIVGGERWFGFSEWGIHPDGYPLEALPAIISECVRQSAMVLFSHGMKVRLKVKADHCVYKGQEADLVRRKLSLHQNNDPNRVQWTLLDLETWRLTKEEERGEE